MRLHTLPLALLLSAAPPLLAQGGDERALVALRATHIGSLTPLITPAMISRRLNGVQLGIRYGLRDEAGIQRHTVAASGIFGAGMASSLALTAGATHCDGCGTAGIVIGLGGDMRIVERGEFLGAGSTLTVAVSGEMGYAQMRLEDDDALTLAVGAPITLTFGATTEGMRIAPFFTPLFAVGQSGQCPLSDPSCERSGQRWVVGGGIGVWNPLTNVSATIGVNHVVAENARPVFGVNVILGGR
jgi:hypothetical protein